MQSNQDHFKRSILLLTTPLFLWIQFYSELSKEHFTEWMRWAGTSGEPLVQRLLLKAGSAAAGCSQQYEMGSEYL